MNLCGTGLVLKMIAKTRLKPLLVGNVALAFALAGCAGTPEPRLGLTADTPIPELGQTGYSFRAPESYQLRPADIISITVFREPELSMASVRVGVDGRVSLPLVGGVEVAGLSTSEAEQRLTERLMAVGLREPSVSVNIADYVSHLVTVDGAVSQSGVYQFQPGARLSSAIALAGGLSRVAKSDVVAVFRTEEDGIYVAKFDMRQIDQGLMLDPVLAPGDRVVVGTDGLSQFWQDTLRAIPLFAIFGQFAR